MVSEWEWVLRLLLASALGGIIGLERESHGREAGFRTLMLVCGGTALIMVTSLRIPELFPLSDANSILRLDPARLAYGTITGIGFLGAGAIVRDEKRIRGITTAACLWVVAAIGLAVGAGFYLMALITTSVSVIILYCLRFVEHFIPKDLYNEVTVVQQGEVDLTPLMEIFTEEKARVLNHQIKVQTPPPMTEVEFTLRHKDRNISERLVKKLLRLPGVKQVGWK